MGLPNPYVLFGALVGLIMLVVASFTAGHHYATLQEDNAIRKAEEKAIAETQARDKITHDADVAEASQQVQIQTRTITETKEVPIYVTKKSVARCVVPRGFVRLLNDSAANVQPVSSAPGQSDDEPSGVGLDTVAASVVGNYGSYAEVKTQLETLQAWVRAQTAVKQ